MRPRHESPADRSLDAADERALGAARAAAKALASLLAAGTLLGAAAANATDIADLPLKASVLAKPNVIFSMDDSGSMDAEIMLNGTFQAWFYANYQNTTLFPGNALRNGSSSTDWPLMYLFPNGTGAGNRVYGDPDSRYGYAAPPTPQMAFLRSPAYNSLYYNTMVTYEPWAPAWLSGTTATSFTAAAPAAARSHPVLGSTTMALNADLSNNTANWRFTFIAGMTIPSGASNVTCLWGTNPTVFPFTVPTANGLCTARIAYYPATFWHRQTCTANGTTCVTNFDGLTLQRYEIKSGNSFPSGRTFEAEMQNFANWFTYHRKRRMMLAGAMGEVLEDITGLRLGVVPFNAHAAPTMRDADATNPANNRLAISGVFYRNEGSGGTPTHATMSYVHTQFDTNPAIIQFACQRNASFIITDGFANDTATAPQSYNAAIYGGTAPYQAITANSLHDKALSKFTKRLRETTSPLPAGMVPLGPQDVTNPDPNPNLHINTYALTLGMRGTIWPNTVDPFVTAPTWPAPVSNTATMIDDLWHATINGRGQMYLATSPAETKTGIQSALLDILSQTGAQGGIAVSTVNLPRGDGFAFLGTYDPAGWAGDLTANTIDPATAEIAGTPTWSASALLLARAWNTRVIASASTTGGVAFTAAAVGSAVNPGNVYGDTAQVIDYLRGDRSLEAGTFRRRTSLMGAVIGSEPAIAREDGVVYVASGEGMLHAFDTKSPDAGKELWAFVPRPVLDTIGETTQRGYAFGTKLDGSPVIGRGDTTARLLVAGMGVAGRSYYALDVSSPRGLTETQLASRYKWEFPAASDTTTQAKVGQTLGRPVIVKTQAEGWVVLVTSGYNNDADGRGRLWMLDADTGSVIREWDTGAGTLAAEAGLAHVTPYAEDDGTVRYVYGGDLLGNLWRFDLTVTTAPHLVAVLKGPTGATQPVTAAPDVTSIKGQRVVAIGTGRLLDITDFGNNVVQSFYVIADGSTLSNARGSLVQQTYVRSSDTLTTTPVDWSTERGWFLDLTAGEHANTRPSIAYGAVAFVTNINGGSDCSASSYFYVLDIASAERFESLGSVSTLLSSTANSSGVTAVLTSSGQVRGLVQDFNAGRRNPLIAPAGLIPPSRNSWREIRR
jgi:type IV pilus assembly protein PilY1